MTELVDNGKLASQIPKTSHLGQLDSNKNTFYQLIEERLSFFARGGFKGKFISDEKFKEECITKLVCLFSAFGVAEITAHKMAKYFIESCSYFDRLAIPENATALDNNTFKESLNLISYPGFMANLIPTLHSFLVGIEFPEVSVYKSACMSSIEIHSSEGRRIRLHKNHFNESVDIPDGIAINTALYRVEITFSRGSAFFNELFSLMAGGYVSAVIPNPKELNCGNHIRKLEIKDN